MARRLGYLVFVVAACAAESSTVPRAEDAAAGGCADAAAVSADAGPDGSSRAALDIWPSPLDFGLAECGNSCTGLGCGSDHVVRLSNVGGAPAHIVLFRVEGEALLAAQGQIMMPEQPLDWWIDPGEAREDRMHLYPSNCATGWFVWEDDDPKTPEWRVPVLVGCTARPNPCPTAILGVICVECD
ncbi:MAG: hypothetical protein AABZ30_00400 [Myxococcota bacterium]